MSAAPTPSSSPSSASALRAEDLSHPAAASRVKRAIDGLFAGVVLVVVSPVLLVAAVAIRLTSRGPALFRQQRVGLDGAEFEILKLRTMVVDSDDAMHRAHLVRLLTDPEAEPTDNGTYKLDDPRVTRVGSFLRRTSIDELPQLVNVLRGQMSLVGPRPMLPWEFELVEGRHRARAATKPGMTGMWQVEGRSDLSVHEMLDLDVDYVEQWTPVLDLRILMRTPGALLSSR